MAALFRGIAKGATTLATAPAPLPPYAKSMNGRSHPHVVYVFDDEVLLSDLDWQL